MSGSTITVRLLGAAATLLLASACGTSSTAAPGGATNAAKAVAPGAASAAGVLGVATTPLGPVLVDSKGFTVYLLTADTPGHSSCDAQCLQFWPLVSAPAGAAVPTVQGVNAALSVTKATSGASMLTAGGWPLYTFFGSIQVESRRIAFPDRVLISTAAMSRRASELAPSTVSSLARRDIAAV